MTTTSIAMTKNAATPIPRRDEREATNGTPPPADASPKGPALPVDRADLSDEQLAARIAQDQAELDRRKARREADYYEQVKEGARQLNIPLARLAAKLGLKSAKPSMLRPAPTGLAAGDLSSGERSSQEEDGRRHVRPKFRNPKDPSQTWSGRGGKPQWVLDHLAAGGTMEQLAIPEGALANGAGQ